MCRPEESPRGWALAGGGGERASDSWRFARWLWAVAGASRQLRGHLRRRLRRGSIQVATWTADQQLRVQGGEASVTGERARGRRGASIIVGVIIVMQMWMFTKSHRRVVTRRRRHGETPSAALHRWWGGAASDYGSD